MNYHQTIRPGDEIRPQDEPRRIDYLRFQNLSFLHIGIPLVKEKRSTHTSRIDIKTVVRSLSSLPSGTSLYYDTDDFTALFSLHGEKREMKIHFDGFMRNRPEDYEDIAIGTNIKVKRLKSESYDGLEEEGEITLLTLLLTIIEQAPS